MDQTKNQLITLRASSAPIAFKCGGSVRPGTVLVNASNDAADVGTAAHDGLATLVDTGQVDWDAVPELAKKHGVDVQELRSLLAQGAKLWAGVRSSFPEAKSELSLRFRIAFPGGAELELTGHPDVLSIIATLARVADHKTGRLDSDYAEQLRGYMALVLLNYPELERAEALILWIRDYNGAPLEPYSMDRNQLGDWLDKVARLIVNWDGVYRPGSHCVHCQRSHECSASNALARRDVAALMDESVDYAIESIRGLVRDTPDKAIGLLELAREMEKRAARVIAALKDEVIARGPAVGSKKRIDLQPSEKRHVLAFEAFPVLQAAMTDVELASVIDVSIAKAEDVVKKKAGKGKGAGAARDLVKKLEEAGAITTKTSVSLVIKREI